MFVIFTLDQLSNDCVLARVVFAKPLQTIRIVFNDILVNGNVIRGNWSVLRDIFSKEGSFHIASWATNLVSLPGFEHSLLLVTFVSTRWRPTRALRLALSFAAFRAA
jgi:hypothetical protein